MEVKDCTMANVDIENSSIAKECFRDTVERFFVQS